MHYYQFNIGDYASHTRHLSRNEDLAYRRLLDLYYLQEKPFPNDPEKLARLILMSDCSADVERVLREFFEPTDDESGLINKRADAEIAKYHGKSEKAREAGKASAESRRQRTLNIGSTDAQPNKKQETRNINQEPRTNNQETTKSKQKRKTVVEKPPEVSEKVWNDYAVTRQKPLTQTAFDGLMDEANKIGWPIERVLRECVVRGWRGFKADWVRDKTPFHAVNKQEALEARNRAVVERMIERDRANGII